MYPTYIVEFFAAAAGLFYLIKSKSSGKADRLLVLYLNFIFVFDLLAITYGLYGYVYNWRYLEFINESWRNIYWIYNILILISGTAYTAYFYLQLQSKIFRRLIFSLTLIYLISSITSFFIGEDFFTTTSSFAYIFCSFLIFFSVIFYYFELLRSDRLLNFSKELPLYISIGLLLYQLGITPLFIFQKYISVSQEFQTLYSWVLDIGNVFMYSVFTYGFLKIVFTSTKKDEINWSKYGL